MTDIGPPRKSGLKNFLLNLLGNYIFVWVVLSLLILATGFLYKILISPLVSLGLSLDNGKLLGVILIICLVLAIALFLTLEKFIPANITMKFQDLNVIKGLRMLNTIRKGGMAFPEVSFSSYEKGKYLFGVRMGQEKHLVPGSDEEILLYSIWELRPFALSGRLHYLAAGEFKLTGRPGWRTILRTFSYGFKMPQVN